MSGEERAEAVRCPFCGKPGGKLASRKDNGDDMATHKACWRRFKRRRPE